MNVLSIKNMDYMYNIKKIKFQGLPIVNVVYTELSDNNGYSIIIKTTVETLELKDMTSKRCCEDPYFDTTLIRYYDLVGLTLDQCIFDIPEEDVTKYFPQTSKFHQNVENQRFKENNKCIIKLKVNKNMEYYICFGNIQDGYYCHKIVANYNGEEIYRSFV